MRRLNICCGANIFPGWINIDCTDLERDYLHHLRDAPAGFVWPPDQQAAARAVKAGELEFMRHDVRTGLPFATGSVDAIYIGQAIEHFNRRTEAPKLLRECARVLKQYGVIRLTTPDLALLCRLWALSDLDQFAKDQPTFYADADNDSQLAYLLFGASGDNCTSENFEGHFFGYSSASLEALLLECGLDVRTTRSAEFNDVVDMGMSHSLQIEGCKP